MESEAKQSKSVAPANRTGPPASDYGVPYLLYIHPGASASLPSGSERLVQGNARRGCLIPPLRAPIRTQRGLSPSSAANLLCCCPLAPGHRESHPASWRGVLRASRSHRLHRCRRLAARFGCTQARCHKRGRAADPARRFAAVAVRRYFSICLSGRADGSSFLVPRKIASLPERNDREIPLAALLRAAG
jgi:hypothetical protein